MKLLIVDDEPTTVESLSSTVPWDSIGISAVYTATSGARALEMARESAIDILLTDIRMPVMSGLELIKQLRSHNERTKYILLSGYREFQYAQEAIVNQVFEYLLKPVSDEDLLKAVGRAVQHLIKEDDHAREFEQVQRIAAASKTDDHPSLSLEDIIVGEKWNLVDDYLTKRFEELERFLAVSAERVIDTFYLIAAGVSAWVQRNGYRYEDVLGEDAELLTHPSPALSLPTLKAWAGRVIEKLRNTSGVSPDTPRSHIIRRVQAFVTSHLADDVSLQAIADEVCLHPVYLSKLYKSETDEALSDYVYRLRMEKASYLLNHTSLRIHDISTQLGYQYAPYFTRVFKQYYGMTPQEYRNRDHRG